MTCSRCLLSIIVLSTLHYASLVNVVVQWNQVALDATIQTDIASPTGSRAMAMTHIAMLDALNRLGCKTKSPSCTPAASSVAVSTAAHRVLTGLFIPYVDTNVFDATLMSVIASVGSGQSDAIHLGTDVGHQSGVNVLMSRINDGSMLSTPYQIQNTTGSWLPSAPQYVQRPQLPHFGNVTPFMAKDLLNMLPAGVPAFNSSDYKNAWDEVFWYGSINSTNRTADQAAQATFWADGSETVFNYVTADLLANQKSQDDILGYAEVFMLLNVARADAGFACWATKYKYNTWRPITAFRQGVPSVPSLQTNSSWTSYLGTPAFPEYVSGHSAFSSASARILALAFGSDNFTFTGSLKTDLKRDRRYNSLWAAAVEAGQSRIYGGIHFQFGNQDGLVLGKKVAEAVYAEWLLHGFSIGDATLTTRPPITVSNAAVSITMSVAWPAVFIVSWMFSQLMLAH